jgi:uncharacterized protein
MEEIIYEVRAINDIQVDEEKRLINGTAILFEQESVNLGGFTEVMKRGSITQELLDNSDIIMKYNHKIMLARRNKGKGSLNVSLDDVGVHFSFRAKKTNTSEEVLQAIKEGDLTGCSFEFGVRSDDPTAVKIVRRSGNVPLQEVYKVAVLRDLSIVDSPAYPQTSVNARALEILTKEEQAEKDEAQKKLDEIAEQERQKTEQIKQEKQKEENFQRYYKNVLNKYLYK